ncbi:hypothetical protein [Mycobacteroides abscessus]|uniref:hypothetical protein n=1 Tax=Mycobacteroides abscessus TaxID=36809 RepID=UPI000C2586AD|nr:hypothetical protein [Mycobacteroides abscessus]
MNKEYLKSYKEVLEATAGDLIALATAWLHVNDRLYQEVGGDIEALDPAVRSYIEAVEFLAHEIAGSE